MQRERVTVGVERTDLQAVTSHHTMNNPPGSQPVAGTGTMPDPNIGRCIQLKLDGGRCKGKAIEGKQGLCMVHCERVADEEA